MIPAQQVLVALTLVALAGVGGGVWLSAWWRRGLGRSPSAGTPSQRASTPRGRAASGRRRPVVDVLGLQPCALYVFGDSTDEVIYGGIADDPQERVGQHAADKPWFGEVAWVRAWWFPNRYTALAAEWTLILFLAPRHNRAPSGASDAWTERQPPIKPAQVELPTSMAGTVRRALRW